MSDKNKTEKKKKKEKRSQNDSVLFMPISLYRFIIIFGCGGEQTATTRLQQTAQFFGGQFVFIGRNQLVIGTN